MKSAKKLLFAALSLCILLSVTSAVACKKTPSTTNPENPTDPATYAVTYAFGDCNGTAYAGSSVLPTESAKEEGAKFNLAAAPVWEGYSFDGWHDGENTYAAGAQYTMPAHAVTLKAQWHALPAKYTITYDFGSYAGTDYEGDSTRPTEASKEEGAKFNLADPLVWEGYTFDGWHDGTHYYEAGEEYTMPAEDVKFTAQWYNWPEGQIKQKDVTVPGWDEHAKTGGYIVEKGQYIQLNASFTGKGLENTEWAGIVAKIYKNCDVSVEGTFYQFRPDFAVDRRDWKNWQEDNRDFNVTDTNWNRSKYISLVSSADVVITVELSEDGVLTYTIDLTSENYNYKRVFSPKNTTMNSALIIFGADGVTVPAATLYRPMPDGVKLSFDWGYDNLFDIKVANPNSTYTIEDGAYRDGYIFLGWQENGEGNYYKSGATYSVGTKRVRFYASWEVDPSTPGLEFSELADGTYSVKKGTANAETVVIPESYHDKPVTQIASRAFEGAAWLKHVVIPESVTLINGRAFYETSLEEVYIPDSVKRIDSNAFTGCAALVNVRVPSGMTMIGTDVFSRCNALAFNEADGACYFGNDENDYVVLIKAKDTSITKCAIEDGCEYIYGSAFAECKLLADVTLPTTLRIIGGSVFKNCSSLTSIVIPDSVIGIGGLAFSGCSGLQSITIPFVGAGNQGGSNHYPFGYIFGTSKYTGGTLTKQTYPGSNNDFPLGQYYVPTSLREITVTGGELYQGAFQNCANITTIRLPATVKSIPINAFNGCSKLTDLYYDGTEADWQKVTKASGNDLLSGVTMHYKED